MSTSGGNSGCDDETFDPGGAGGIGYPEGIGVPPGETAQVRLWVTDNHNQPVSSERLRIGIGLYEKGAPARQTAAGDIPELQEEDGHTWRLTEVVESQPGDRSLELVDDTEGPTLVYHYSAHAGHTLERVLLDGVEIESTLGLGSGSGPVGPPDPAPAPTASGSEPTPVREPRSPWRRTSGSTEQLRGFRPRPVGLRTCHIRSGE